MSISKPAFSQPPTPLEDNARTLAAALRDVIEATDQTALEQDPEKTFVDLAARLMLRLRGQLAIEPYPTPTKRIQRSYEAASFRVLNVFTRWMRSGPGRSYETRISDSGKFQLIVKSPAGTRVHFGEDAQDVCAQAAQTIGFDEGLL